MSTTTTTSPQFEQLRDLVGRETEIQLLLDAYERVLATPSSCEAVLVHGESGTGKTALVKHSFLRQCDDDGTMIVGKFDIIHNNARPYSAIVDALTQLCQAKTWNNISNQEEFKNNLRSRLCTMDLNILSNLVPAVEQRLEGQELDTDSSFDLASIDTTFAYSIFAEVVRKFLFLLAGVLSSPLILFLDDVQAADPESLSLISSLTSLHSESQNLLFVLAYRDHVDPEQQLNKSSILSSSTVFRVTDINLLNLDLEDLNTMVRKMLRRDSDDTMPLSRLISQRTNGNIYFSLQFLKMLKSEKLLGYSFYVCQWVWNVEKIRTETNVTDNVALLLTSKIRRLPSEVQSALQLAACLGFYFDVAFLERIALQEKAAAAVVTGTSAEEEVSNIPGGTSRVAESKGNSAEDEHGSSPFSHVIAVAVEENLIDRACDTKYKFSHDRVEQAAYELIPAGKERDMLHWRIGQVLWTELQHRRQHHGERQNMPEIKDNFLLFAAAEQLNRGSNCMPLNNSDGVDALALARLNLEAGKATLDKSAFRHAAGFFDMGVTLTKGMWQSEYALCLELHTLSAEAEYAASNFEMCDIRTNEILANGRCMEDKLPAYLVKVQSQGVRGRILEAMDESVTALREIGEPVPRRPNLFQLLYELDKTKRVLKGRNVAELMLLPNMVDPLKVWATKFLQSAAIFSWFAGQKNSLVVAILRMVQMTVKFGVSSQGPFAVATYGLLLGLLGDLNTAYDVGRVAMELSKRPHTVSCRASTITTVYSFLNHLKNPAASSLEHFLDGYNSGMKFGDIEGAAMCLTAYASMGIFLGKKLEIVVSEMEGFRQVYRDLFANNFSLFGVTAWHQLVLNLMGRSENPLRLDGEIINEESFMSEVRRTGNEIARATLNVARMILCFILGDVEAANQEVSLMDMDVVSKGTHFATPFLSMYAGLVMLAMFRKTRRRKFWSRGQMFKGVMQKFVKAGNLNMPPMLAIVSAEQKSLGRRSRYEDIKTGYEDAVRMAAVSGFTVVEAISNERAGEYMKSIGDTFWAESYLTRAFRLYDEWGAITKVDQMLTEHEFLTHLQHQSSRSVSVTLRKRYSYRETNEHRRLSLP